MGQCMNDEQFHSLLPSWVQVALRKAATDPLTAQRPLARHAAIEGVLAQVRMQFPQLVQE